MFGERRTNQRTTINRVAKLVAESGAPIGDCVVIDISDSGARLLCENVTAPDTFRLAMAITLSKRTVALRGGWAARLV
jgi:hypothetical protein